MFGRIGRFTRGRRGVGMILGVLVYAIISVVILFILFRFVSETFFGGETNLEIAKSDGVSFVDFVDFSSETYGEFDDCYTMLKLVNLENYQYRDEKGQNFFYVIDQDGIYIFDMELLETVKKEGKFNPSLSKGFEPFNKRVNIEIDDTKSYPFSVNMFFFFDFLKSSNDVNRIPGEFVILFPEFKEKVFGVETFVIGTHSLFGKGFYKGEDYDPSGAYLVFSPSSNSLFLSKSEYSNALIKARGCSFFKQEYLLKSEVLSKDPYAADFYNEKIYFDFVNNDGRRENFVFVWKIDEIICPMSEGKSCEDYLSKDHENITYRGFVDKIKEVYWKKFSRSEGDMKIVKRESLSALEVYLVSLKGKDAEYEHDKTVFILEHNGINKFLDEYDKNPGGFDKGDIKKVLKGSFGKNVFHGFHDVRKEGGLECIGIVCDYLLFRSPNVYFYDGDLNRFVKFREDLLRLFTIGDEYEEIYFMGKGSNFYREEFDGLGVVFDKDYKFYVGKIFEGEKKRTVIISQAQKDAIERLK